MKKINSFSLKKFPKKILQHFDANRHTVTSFVLYAPVDFSYLGWVNFPHKPVFRRKSRANGQDKNSTKTVHDIWILLLKIGFELGPYKRAYIAVLHRLLRHCHNPRGRMSTIWGCRSLLGWVEFSFPQRSNISPFIPSHLNLQQCDSIIQQCDSIKQQRSDSNKNCHL